MTTFSNFLLVDVPTLTSYPLLSDTLTEYVKEIKYEQVPDNISLQRTVSIYLETRVIIDQYFEDIDEQTFDVGLNALVSVAPPGSSAATSHDENDSTNSEGPWHLRLRQTVRDGFLKCRRGPRY